MQFPKLTFKEPAIVTWFFEPAPAKTAATFRIAIGFIYTLIVLSFLPYLTKFFTEAGYITSQTAQDIYSSTGSFSLLYYFPQTGFMLLAYAVMLGAGIAYTFGIFSRYMSILMYVLFLSFANRFPPFVYGGNVVLLIMLFFNIFLPTDRAYTPKWYAKKYGTDDTVVGWPVRLIQFQLVYIYLFAGISKFRDTSWSDGTAMQSIFNFTNFTVPNLAFLRHVPIVGVVFTFASMITELAFPFLIWQPITRRHALYAMFLLHLGIMSMMNITYFSEIMIASLMIFIQKPEIDFLEKVWAWITKRIPKRGAGRR